MTSPIFNSIDIEYSHQEKYVRTQSPARLEHGQFTVSTKTIRLLTLVFYERCSTPLHLVDYIRSLETRARSLIS